MRSYDPLANRRASLMRQISEAQAQLDALEFVPQEDTYADGTIIRAEITHRGRYAPLTYVFLKVVNDGGEPQSKNVRWYHTGFLNHGGMRSHAQQYFEGWAELQSWLAETGRVVETWDACIKDPGPRIKRAHEDVMADILDVLRAAYDHRMVGTDDARHAQVVDEIMRVRGVWE